MLRLRGDMGTAVIWFRNGELIDAQCGKLRSVNAVFRALRFETGSYVIEYGDPTRPVRIDAPLQSLIDEAARRAAQVCELVQRLPSFDQLLVVNTRRLGPLDEEQRQLVGLFRPHCSIDEALDLSEAGELETLMLLEQLVDVGVLEPASNKPRYRADEPTVEIAVPPAVRIPDDEETTTVKEIPRRPSPPPVVYDEETTAVKEIPRRSEPAPPVLPPVPSPPKARPVPAAKPPPPPEPSPPLPRAAPIRPALSPLPPPPPAEIEMPRITPPPPPPRISSVPPERRRRGLSLLILVSSAIAGALAYLYFEVWETRWPWVEAADLPGTTTATSASAAASVPRCPAGMVLIDAGRFFMGTDSQSEELAASVPAHQVELRAYCIGKNEVTMAEYEACARANKCARLVGKADWPRPRAEAIPTHKRTLELFAEHCNAGKPGRRNHPANCVTFREAEDYCRYRSARLPREAEWEFAARGSDGRVFPWGDDAPSAQHANGCGAGDCKRWHEQVDLDAHIKTTLFQDDDGYGGTAPAGSFPAGATKNGISDMIGNVAEWTSDAFRLYRGAKAELDEDPSARTVRGGSFLTARPERADASAREAVLPSVRSPAVGFRCAANPR